MSVAGVTLTIRMEGVMSGGVGSPLVGLIYDALAQSVSIVIWGGSGQVTSYQTQFGVRGRVSDGRCCIKPSGEDIRQGFGQKPPHVRVV